MIKVLNVYARFHVYMYINMCLDFANLFNVVIFSMSLCELLNNLLNIFISIW